LKLRDYQEEAVQSLYSHFRSKDTVALTVLPTGTGKAFVIASVFKDVLERTTDKRVLCLVHTVDLVGQNAETLEEIWGGKVGINAAGLNRRDCYERVIFASIQTVHKKAMHLGSFDLICIDEAHLISSTETGIYRKFLKEMQQINPNVKIWGLTATDFRLKGGLLTDGDEALFDEVIYDKNMLWFFEHNYLSPLISKPVINRVDTQGLHTRAGEFISKEVNEKFDKDEITRKAVAEIIEFGQDRVSWIVFCSGVDHANHVQQELIDQGVDTVCITGKTAKVERAKAIKRFKSLEIKCLVGVDVLTTGFNAPTVDLIAFLRPTQSPGLLVQMAGRGTRLSPETGKKDCLLLDFSGNLNRHGPIDQIKGKSKKRGSGGEAPQKYCLGCGAICHANVRICADCGYEFEIIEKPKHEATASTAAALSIHETGRATLYKVDRTTYSKHTKKGGQDSMRVTYWMGLLEICSEWVCFEHHGFPRTKAVAWWYARTDTVVPDTVIEALNRVDVLKSAKGIHVDKSGKYPEIKGVEF
jgi:DNA repair protein RadD